MRSRKSVVFVIIFILFVPLLGFTLPQLAVLEAILAAGLDPTVGPLVTSKIEEEFVNSGKYRVLDRANVGQILQEKEFQLSSGIVRNEEVRQAGEYLGADFVVVANVSRVGQTYVIAAKMIDVVSGEIAAQTSYERQGRIDVLLDIARIVGGRLAGTELVLIAVEEPEVEEEPAEEEVAEAPKVEVEVKPPREIKPVEFKRFLVGAKGGGNLANIIGDDWYWWGSIASYYDSDESPASIFTFNAGAFFALNLTKIFALQAEILFTQKGYSFYFYEGYDPFLLAGWEYFNPFLATWVDYGYGTSTWTFNYLELPVLLKVSLPGKVGVYGIFGVSISAFIAGSVHNSYDDPLAQEDFDFFFTNPDDVETLITVNTLDIGAVAGVGVEYVLGSVVFDIEIRYTIGFMDVSDVPFKNSVFSLTGGVGYRF